MAIVKNFKRIFLWTILLIFLLNLFTYNKTSAQSLIESFILKQLISKNYPWIKYEKNEFIKVNLLRQYTYENVDMGKPLLGPEFNKKSALELLTAFFQDKGGMMCRGHAFTLMKIYEVFGFRSYVLSMGRPNIVNHSLVLVETNYNGHKILSIQDPYFNITYIHQDGFPLDYFEFLSILKAKRHNLIKIQKGVIKKKDILRFKSSNIRHSWNWGNDIEFSKILPDGRVKYRGYITLEKFEKGHHRVGKTKSFLKSKGYPENLIYLFLFPKQLVSEGNPEKLYYLLFFQKLLFSEGYLVSIAYL